MSASGELLARDWGDMKSRIGIVDDHPSLILGVSAILNAQPDMQVVSAAATVDTLLLNSRTFDLCLLDLVLADGSTPTANMEKLAATGATVLVYTSGEWPNAVREVARAGASGMIRKSELPAEVVATVRAALRGEPIVTPEWARAIIGDQAFVNASLSPRESEVLVLYASGDTADEVASRLFISRATVVDHIRTIRRKYASVDRPAATKVDLFRRAVEDGLVGRDD